MKTTAVRLLHVLRPFIALTPEVASPDRKVRIKMVLEEPKKCHSCCAGYGWLTTCPNNWTTSLHN